MENNKSYSCKLILILYPNIIYFETTLPNNIFLKTLSRSLKLNISNFNNDFSSLELSKILLIDSDNNIIIIICRNIIIVKKNNIIEIFEDPNLILLSYIVKQLAKDYYDKIKYYLDIERYAV
jgi:hypothetical protein